jgi:rhodanese-related sulfurtransferase
MRADKAALIIALTCILAFALTGCGDKAGTAPNGNENDIANAAIMVASGYAQGPYQLLTVEQLKDWADLGEIMTIIDVRPADEYAKGHIADAVNVEIDRTQESTTDQIAALLAELPSNHESIVVIYDDYTALNGSHRAAVYASDAAYTKVYRLVAGRVGWQAAGHKLTKK